MAHTTSFPAHARRQSSGTACGNGVCLNDYQLPKRLPGNKYRPARRNDFDAAHLAGGNATSENIRPCTCDDVAPQHYPMQARARLASVCPAPRPAASNAAPGRIASHVIHKISCYQRHNQTLLIL